ncbi:MAG: NAD(P)/FAD-dependent oxidoreductase [Actinomycetota bacterium]|nr:NAD(P)/FAD-dependent oxidoreductase [Actinomycetota bacterium]
MPATANGFAPETTSPAAPDHEVVIVGTGFAGIGAAIKLKEAGIEDFVVFDKATEVAGTWRENTYPGCACDVPSHMYSFSFEQNPDWSEMYAPQPEIRAYLERVTDKYGVRPHLRLGVRAVAAEWDEAAGLWRCEGEGPDGSQELTARFLISGIGGLHVPAKPHLQGLESFEGAAFHSAEWDHSVDLTGKKVAVIGTGASAIQFVPAIAGQVGRLDLYQRTAPWVLPKLDRRIPKFERRLYRRFPFLQRAYRRGLYWYLELVIYRGITSKRFGRLFERAGLKNLERQVSDPVKREKLRPTYEFGCKRMLMSNDYYEALDRPNADVVTEPIAEVGPHSITTADGTTREADVIIYGTGFDTQAMASSVEIKGEAGQQLAELWQREGIQAHRGTMISGFPNLFFLLGPNTGLGHNSVVFMIECQIRLVVQAIQEARRRHASVAPTRAAQDAYNAKMQADLGDAVWSRGCKSWYLDAQGRNITLWPGETFRFYESTRKLDPAEFEWVAPGVEAPAVRGDRRLAEVS